MTEPQPILAAPLSTTRVTTGRVIVCIGVVLAAAGAFFTFPLGPEPFQLVFTVPATIAGLLLVGTGILTSTARTARWQRIGAWLLIAVALIPVLVILSLYLRAVA